MCSGASGVRVAPESEDELRLGEALDALLRQLAMMIVADGEGARRIARVLVRGGRPAERVEAVARAVANSPLVKAALHGGDPNWGRIVQAVGAALPGTAPLAVDVAIEGMPVCAAGAAIGYDAAALDARGRRSTRSSTRSACPARAPRPRCSSPTSAHDYVDASTPEYTT